MKLPESVNSFINNYKDKHPEKKSNGDVCCKNIYHIQTEDRDGNITGEYFGSNLITDLGFSDYIYRRKDYNTRYGLAIGTGIGTISRSDTALFNQLVLQEDNSLFDGNMYTSRLTPITFDSSTNYLTQFIKLKSITYNYNLDGVTTDQTITEIGIVDYYAYISKLITHSKIYDINGDEITFVKHVDEKVTITLYLGITFNVVNTVNTLWSNNLFSAISPTIFLEFSYGLGGRQEDTLAYLYSRRNVMRIKLYEFLTTFEDGGSGAGLSVVRSYDSTNGIKYFTASHASSKPILMEHMYYLTSFVITNGVQSSTSWSDLCSLMIWVTHKAGFCLQSPELIETTVMTNIDNDTFENTLEVNSYSSELVSYTDYRGRLPLNQLTITSLKHYDYNQHDWVDETFTQDSSYLYDKQMYKGIWYFTTVDGVDGEWWIHVNTKTDYPIISMGTVSSSAVIYATDTYWDTSTWVRITLPDDVPVALRNKKYYIINNSNAIDPIYSYTKPALTQLNPEYSIPDNGIKMYMVTDPNIGPCRNKVILPNPECNCLVHPNVILYPDDVNDIVSYTITNYGNATVTDNYVGESSSAGFGGTLSVFKLTEDGDRLIMAQQGMTNFRSGCYRIYTISDDKTVAPVAKDLTVGFTHTSNMTPTFHSFTDKGYLVTVHNDDNEIKIIDLYANDGEEVSSITGKWGHALNRTTYCVYQDIDGENALTFVVYDMSTSTIVKRFTLNYNASVNGIGGWKNHVYIRIYDTTSSTYKLIYHNITTDNTVEFDTDPTGASNTSNRSIFNHTNLQSGWDNSFKSCDECMIVPIGIPMPGDNYPNSAYQEMLMQFKLVFDNNPTEFVTLLPSSYTDPANYYLGNIVFYTCGNFAYKSDGSFFGLEIVVNYDASSFVLEDAGDRTCCAPRSAVLFDLGNYIDNGYVPDMYRFNVHRHDNKNWKTNGMLIGYKDHVITPGDNNTLKFIPFERCYIHKLTGTTTSVQTINNPKRIKPNNTITFTAQN